MRSGDGAVVDETFSGAGGSYKFDNVAPDDYYVIFLLADDLPYFYTDRHQGTDRAKDSDAQSSDVFTLSGGEHITDIDGGYVPTPKVDLDTDSDNSGAIDGTKAEDSIELTKPKRIFVNKDDDNINGLPDDQDAKAVYTAASKSDDDFAELSLKALKAPAGSEAWLAADAGLSLWADNQKTPLTGDRTETSGGKTWLVWDIANLPSSAYAEGTTVGVHNVEFNLYVPDGNGGHTLEAGDEVAIGVEILVWPNQDSTHTWDKTDNTSEWNGFELSDGWFISVPLVSIINGTNGYVRTEHPKSTANGWEGDGIHNTPASLDLAKLVGGTSWDGSEVLVEVTYEFPGNPNISTGKYTDITKANTYKPGLFANSGVFVAESTGKMEIQIFDTKALLDVIATDTPQTVDGATPTVSGTLAANGDVQLSDPTNGNWTVENANALITGIPYAHGVGSAAALNAAPQGGKTMELRISRASGVYTVKVTIDGVQKTYTTGKTSSNNEGASADTLNLQSHWGSGVKFTSAKVRKI